MTSPSAVGTAIRVLLIDDDGELTSLMRDYLTQQGFAVSAAGDGPSGLRAALAGACDVVMLDVMLPGLDGFEVLRQLRQRSRVPVIMLTARTATEDRVNGLDAGADDYLPKPFKFKELLARIRAVLRRRTSAAERVLRFGTLELNRDTREVHLDGRPIHLTPRELDLLEVFMLHPRQVMTRDVLLDRVWGTDYLGDGNLIEVHISALRDKLGDTDRRLIRTVRGVGYALSGAGLG